MPRSPWCRTTTRSLAIIAALAALTGCFSAASYSAPSGARLATGARFTPESQQGRWICNGWDLVLADGTLYDLNDGYAMTRPGEFDDGALYSYKISTLEVLFSIPADRSQPARVAAGSTAAEECPAAPPVTVW